MRSSFGGFKMGFINDEKVFQTAILVGLDAESDYASLVQLIDRLEFLGPYLNFVHLSGSENETRSRRASQMAENLADSVLRNALLAACGKGIPCEARRSDTACPENVLPPIGSQGCKIIAIDGRSLNPSGIAWIKEIENSRVTVDGTGVLINRGTTPVRGKIIASLNIDESDSSSRCVEKFFTLKMTGISDVHLFPGTQVKTSSVGKRSKASFESKTLERFKNSGYRTYFHNQKFESGDLENATKEIGGDLLIRGWSSDHLPRVTISSLMAATPEQLSVFWI